MVTLTTFLRHLGWWCLMTMILLPLPAAATVLANVNKTTLVEGDTLVLRIRTRAEQTEIDLAPLLTDFRVLSQSHTTSSTQFSGLRNTFIEWELQLAPRRTGRLEVPALSVGQEQTRPIAITVLPMSQQQRSQQQQWVQLNVDIDDRELYVGQSTVVTLELLYTVQINGSFADITPHQAEWEQLGERANGVTERNGQEYRFTRFTYVFTPNEAGPYELPAFTFNGTYRQNAWAPAQTINGLSSAPIALTVKPIPAQFPRGATWLPARDLTVVQQWSEDDTRIPSGHQIIRSAQLSATGPARHRLPDLLTEDQLPSGLRAYPSLPDTRQQVVQGQRLSQRQERVSYLFTQAGEYRLPDVRIPWWDLDTDQLRWADLPGRTFTVSGPAVPPLTVDTVPSTALAPTLDTSRTRPFGWAYWLVLGLVVLNGALLWHLLNQRSPAWPTAVMRALRWRPYSSRKANKPVRPASLPAEDPQVTSKSTAADWREAIVTAAQTHQWSALLRHLSQRFKHNGWPDAERIGTHFKQPQFATLVRDTQALHYGADQGTDAQHRLLAARWEALLAGWPTAPTTQRTAEKPETGIKKLYPD